MIIYPVIDMLTDTNIKINNKKIETNMDVPQKNVPSPALFNLFINDLLIGRP